MLFKRISGMALGAAIVATMVPTTASAQTYGWYDGYGQGQYEGYDEGYGDGRYDGYRRGHSNGYDRGWEDASDYDRVYEQEVRHYHRRCQRSSGTGGLVIGALAGGLFGREVARDRTAGAIIGGGVGALAGRAIDRGGERC